MDSLDYDMLVHINEKLALYATPSYWCICDKIQFTLIHGTNNTIVIKLLDYPNKQNEREIYFQVHNVRARFGIYVGILIGGQRLVPVYERDSDQILRNNKTQLSEHVIGILNTLYVGMSNIHTVDRVGEDEYWTM